MSVLALVTRLGRDVLRVSTDVFIFARVVRAELLRIIIRVEHHGYNHDHLPLLTLMGIGSVSPITCSLTLDSASPDPTTVFGSIDLLPKPFGESGITEFH